MNNRSNVLKIKDIYEFLNSISPFELQEKWDNSGLLVGNMSDSFESLYLSMELDLDLVKNLKPNSLVITHHPLIFSGLKRVNYDTYSTKILKELIKKDIALISMHTNIDKTHLNRFVVEKILDFKIENQNEFIANVKIDMSFTDEVQADCFITGDIKYHDAMEAKARAVSLIDIRHYESEKHFNILLEELLEEYLKKNKLKAIITASKNPFEFF